MAGSSASLLISISSSEVAGTNEDKPFLQGYLPFLLVPFTITQPHSFIVRDLFCFSFFAGAARWAMCYVTIISFLDWTFFWCPRSLTPLYPSGGPSPLPLFFALFFAFDFSSLTCFSSTTSCRFTERDGAARGKKTPASNLCLVKLKNNLCDWNDCMW